MEATMDESLSHQPILLPIIGAMLGRIGKAAAVLLLAVALGVPTQVMFGKSNQQQEQQQREREQQQREQQQRDQQERDRQQRDQQQREHQQREQEQQQREQQERLEQQRHSSSNSSATSSNAGSGISHPVAPLPATDVKPTTSDSQPLSVERKISSSPENPRATKNQAQTAIDQDLHGKICAEGPCKPPATQPIQVKPSAPERDTKLCKDGPCKPCPAVQSRAKDGSCALTSNTKTAAPQTSPKPVVQQACPAGQVWNGTQCQLVGAQQCMLGQGRVGASCQDCAIVTGGAENIIERVRSARQSKEEICMKNPHGIECQQAELDYDLILGEYRNFLAGVPMGCEAGLPDPIAI
jgi:hypothetical protein